MLKWTVGIVNFRSIDYIENQLKILYEFNNPEEFELIVVDNSEPSEIGGMSELCAKYIEKHKNLILIERGNEFDDVTNSQHSSGLNLILMKAKGKYLLVQDPDFFWTQKNYLNTFER